MSDVDKLLSELLDSDEDSEVRTVCTLHQTCACDSLLSWPRDNSDEIGAGAARR